MTKGAISSVRMVNEKSLKEMKMERIKWFGCFEEKKFKVWDEIERVEE